MGPFEASDRVVVGVGLGGICEGWLYPLLLLQQTGILPVGMIMLIDGKDFKLHNRQRQQVGELRNKAQDRHTVWSQVFPSAPLRFVAAYVTAHNISSFITDGSIVLLSPDNHRTRKLVSDHAETLNDVLLISAGNDAIDKVVGTDGSEAMAIVHCKREGRNLTPPITRHHPAIAVPHDDSPATLGCAELAQAGQPQLLATNLLAGQLMVQLLWRYCSLPPEQACEVIELWGSTKSGYVSPYGHDLRPL
jgi:hypothetical protein